ncbi:MAG: tetraacyldisaccharide 4'-kinase [Fidelibacterota bacterium]
MKIIRTILTPFAMLYQGITNLRNYFYDMKILKSHELKIPVISIGNITAGGTGKTPFAIALAMLLKEKDFKPAIITRGYKRNSKGQMIVSEGEGPIVTAADSGDEPFLMAKKTKDVVIIVDADRYAAGKTAQDKYKCDIVIADDGFQHRRLHRDVDIVLWDAYSSPYEEHLIPRGRLRESFHNLKRADFLVFTRTQKPKPDYVSFFHDQGMECFTAPTEITTIKTAHKHIDRNLLKGKKLLAFCGLGNPEQFFDTVKQLEPAKLLTATFPDHHKYTNQHIERLLAKSRNTDYLITTEKDRANIPAKFLNRPELLFLSINMYIPESLLNDILNRL